MFDWIREVRIRHHFWAAVATKDTDVKRKHFDKMNALIRQRSKRQVERMEKAKGLQ